MKRKLLLLVATLMLAMIMIPAAAFAEDTPVDPVGGQPPAGDTSNPPAGGDQSGNPTQGDEPTVKEGWIDGYFYVHDALAEGWNADPEKADKQYFFKDGKYYTGVEGKELFKDGQYQSGKVVKKIDGKYYFFNNGKYATGVAKVGGKNHYFKNGVYATGIAKIGSTPYYFKSGSLGPKGWAKVGSNKYYCLGSGKLAKKFRAIGKYGYYFSPSSRAMVHGKKVGHLKIPASGKLDPAYAYGIKVLNKKGWTLKAAYKYAYKTKYANRWMRKKTSESYAKVGFKTRHGNCYVMAAQFYIMGKLLGYDIHQVHGKVNILFPHSWTEIKQGKKTWVYDPNFRNETGRNGWKIYYGKKGTWRYGKHSRMN